MPLETIFLFLAQMKVFNKANLEKIAVEKHGSLEEIKAKQDKKSEEMNTKIGNRDEETRNLWDCDEIYEPMKQFMTDIDLPVPKTSQYFGKKQATHDIKHGDNFC